MREGMESNHKKRMGETVKWARAEILDNGSTVGTNGTVPNLSMPRPMRKTFNEKKNRMTGTERKGKEREE